jgi:hypothetical protein
MNQRQLQKRPVPADYPVPQAAVASAVQPAALAAAPAEGQQLLIRFGVANASGSNVEAKAMLAKDPQGKKITVQV